MQIIKLLKRSGPIWHLWELLITLYNIHCILMENKSLGEFEELVLLAVCILEGDAYGISVKRELEKHSERSILLGAVHITLYRLQDKGFLQSKMGGSSDKRGDRRKRLFKVTEIGMKQLRAAQEVRQKMWSLIPQLN